MHFYGSVEATGVEPVSSDRDYASYVCNLSGDLPGSAYPVESGGWGQSLSRSCGAARQSLLLTSGSDQQRPHNIKMKTKKITVVPGLLEIQLSTVFIG